MAAVAYRAHHVAGAPPDVRTRQNGAIQKGAHAVMLDHGGPLDLVHEAAAKDAFDGASGVIGTDREQKRRDHAMPAEQLDQIGNALARSAKRVDVDFKPEPHDRCQSTRARASATCDR